MLDIAKRINALDENKQLYFASDEGTGLLIFYRDSAWAQEFMRITQVPLFPDPNLIHG